MTRLVPVKDWNWNRYKIQFLTEENGKVILEDELITDDSHIDSEVQDRWPNGVATYYTYELLESNVTKQLRFEPGYYGGTRVVGAGWKSRNFR